jgi:hypothetical protein
MRRTNFCVLARVPLFSPCVLQLVALCAMSDTDDDATNEVVGSAEASFKPVSRTLFLTRVVSIRLVWQSRTVVSVAPHKAMHLKAHAVLPSDLASRSGELVHASKQQTPIKVEDCKSSRELSKVLLVYSFLLDRALHAQFDCFVGCSGSTSLELLHRSGHRPGRAFSTVGGASRV